MTARERAAQNVKKGLEMTAKETVDRIRKVISECTDSELALIDELMVEAEGWRMRQKELEEEGED